MADEIDGAQERALELTHRALARQIAGIRNASALPGRTDCEDCEGRIEDARLHAVPSARRCVACQRDHEQERLSK